MCRGRGATRVLPALLALLATMLGGCIPDTITPLAATDGEPPARDRALLPDEDIIRRDAEPRPADAACTAPGADRGPDAADSGCATDGGSDTLGDSRAEERRARGPSGP